MKRLGFVLTMALIALVSLPVFAQQQGGCIGKALDTCLKNLHVGFHFDQFNHLAEDIRRNEAVDVNGHRLNQNPGLVISGNLVGFGKISQSGSVFLRYTQDKIVSSIEVSLPSDPALANTTEEYAKSGLYEGIVLLMGSECSAINRMEVYKFFQNTVKPHIINEGKKTEFHDTGVETSYTKEARDIPFCGKKFSYANQFGYNTEDITLNNPHGVSAITTISFE